MLANNSNFLYIYDIILEVFICFSSFTLFFGIFMNYFFIDYEINLIINFFKESLQYYPELFIPTKNSLFTSKDIININNQNNQNNINSINDNNNKLNNINILIICMLNLFFLLLLIIPIIFGVVIYKYLNLKKIIFTFLLELTLLVCFELILFLVIFKYCNPVRLYKIFEDNKIEGINA
jgi:hypothetical protein